MSEIAGEYGRFDFCKSPCSVGISFCAAVFYFMCNIMERIILFIIEAYLKED